MGAWIEIFWIFGQDTLLASHRVAPFMGAWIEICESKGWESISCLSHPSWVRGLKCLWLHRGCGYPRRRTLHGCVDWNHMEAPPCTDTYKSHLSWEKRMLTYFRLFGQNYCGRESSMVRICIGMGKCFYRSAVEFYNIMRGCLLWNTMKMIFWWFQGYNIFHFVLDNGPWFTVSA